MAIYHYKVGERVSRGAGQSAVKVAAYMARDRFTDDRTGYAYNYQPKDRDGASAVEKAAAYIDRSDGYDQGHKPALFTGLYAPQGAPEWARSAENIEGFWNRAEAAEKRRDAQIAERMIIALPHELTLEQNVYLVQDYIKKFTRDGRAVQVAIHPSENGDERNVHCHLLVALRPIDENGFAARKAAGQQDRYLHRRQYVTQLREDWTEVMNRHLGRHGIADRVDHRSLAARGIDRTPNIHLGPGDSRRERRGERNAAGQINREIADRNVERHNLREQVPAIDRAARIARLKHDSMVDRVESGWRDKTVEDVARELSPAYAAALKDIEQVTADIKKAERTAAFRQQDKTVHEGQRTARWQKLGVLRKALHKVGVQDRQVATHETESRKAEYVRDKMKTRSWALQETLRQTEAKRDVEFQKVREHAEAVFAERKTRAAAARDQLRTYYRERDREHERPAQSRSRQRGRDHDWGR